MIFRKEKEHGVLTEEEILDMARDIAENDPAYIIGSMLIKSVCDDTGLDEGAAFSMLLDGEQGQSYQQYHKPEKEEEKKQEK